jgi:hypothetical protein
MERVLGYLPHAAQERLRVARALGQLPVLEAALAEGELSFSAIRELTRVATPASEAAWASAASGKNLRQIETLVTGHRPGDLPDDPPDPEVRTHVVRFELSPETFAAFRQARAILDTEHGTHLTDDELIVVLANTVLDGSTGVPDTTAPQPATRAKHQVAVTICARCKQGWQLGAGAVIAIGPAAVERAECDAQHIGSLDDDVPQRAYQDISPAVARLVWRRDEGRCQTPGCRSARGLEIHHVVSRRDGGGHGPENLRVHCSACHHALHAGRLGITGDGKRVDASNAQRLDLSIVRAQAKDALVGLGWSPAISRAAIDAAISALGTAAELRAVIREALRQCPKPHL